MKILKGMVSRLPFFTYSKKVDFAVRNMIAIKKIKYIPLIIVFRNPVDSIIESRMKRMGLKIKYTLPFLNGICGKFPVKNFETLLNILEIDKIYFDGKAALMQAQPMAIPKPVPMMGDSEEKKYTAIEAAALRPSYLSGKGVTVAFIDSGVYPHPDFLKPKNRIVAFKDFVNGLEHPYDDNGHGTACIGAGFGASVDGKFRAPAYDADIVCAKAFDRFSSGFYSDILAAMQWILDIREKHNIRAAVLPFGTTVFSQNFDILSRAVKILWEQGLFVCTCSGNTGPNEGSITSPGVSAYGFTSGACDTRESAPQAAPFTGRGPIYTKGDKPDVIMPGLHVATLNTNTDYYPESRGHSAVPPLSILYREISGTSVSASLTAAVAALLFQKKEALSPDDAKSILKTCAVSINEIKAIQGAGIISIKKLEDNL